MPHAAAALPAVVAMRYLRRSPEHAGSAMSAGSSVVEAGAGTGAARAIAIAWAAHGSLLRMIPHGIPRRTRAVHCALSKGFG